MVALTMTLPQVRRAGRAYLADGRAVDEAYVTGIEKGSTCKLDGHDTGL